ncbi:uncharacterized protein LOC131078394 [Cryptomeria japonica]|uniref:uncharacterized protein LOC131078394 n=1 Tax=Cryptomeria japonica TaxID=3369 RepID=UPI0025AD4ADF|nr:uncharacterized protein LOC131078394 [Cryptomeria japonica]
MEAAMGAFVADYVQEDCCPNSPIMWKRVGERKSDNGVKVANILNSRKIYILSENDSLIWNAAKSGNYKVGLGYELQRKRQKDCKWPVVLCWDKWVLPKAGAFLWIALHERIITSDRLKSISIAGPSRCCFCKKEEESAEHLLYSCSYSRQFWDWLQLKLQNYMVYNSTFKDFIFAWPTGGKFSKWGSLWITSPSMVVWHMWKERNKRIFMEEEMVVTLLINKIQVAVEETINGKIYGSRFKYYSK